MKSNSKLITGLLIGAAAGVALSLLANTTKGKKVIEDIKDASGKAEKDLKKALSRFEGKLSEGKEYIGKLEKKAGKFAKKLQQLMNIEKQGFFRDMKELGEEYVQERLNLIKLEGAEKAARMSAVMVTGIILSLLLVFGLFFLSLMGVYFIYRQTGNWYLGFGIVAAFYFLLAIIILLLKKSRIYPLITNKVIKLLFEKQATEDEL